MFKAGNRGKRAFILNMDGGNGVLERGLDLDADGHAVMDEHGRELAGGLGLDADVWGMPSLPILMPSLPDFMLVSSPRPGAITSELNGPGPISAQALSIHRHSH